MIRLIKVITTTMDIKKKTLSSINLQIIKNNLEEVNNINSPMGLRIIVIVEINSLLTMVDQNKLESLNGYNYFQDEYGKKKGFTLFIINSLLKIQD